MDFVHKFWYLVKDDIMKLFKDFHEANTFMKSLDSTFLVLIAKVEGAVNIKEFRPISLVGSIYKFIAKYYS